MKKLRAAVRKLVRGLSMAVFRLLPVKRGRVLLMSYYGKHINCNPKAIYDYMRQNLSGYEYAWVGDRAEVPDGCVSVKYCSVRFYYYLRTSEILIFNTRPNIDIKKRRGQYYIQTWHSSLGFKMIEADAADTLSQNYIKYAKRDSRYIDILLSGCRFRTECFRRNFWYDGRIAEWGIPRNDVLFSEQKQEISTRVRRELGIPEKNRVMLYAPTFRERGNTEYLRAMDVEAVRTALAERFGGEWSILYRTHPNVRDYALPHGAVNATDYAEMQHLLIAADVFVTDYSSAMFDFSLLGRPVLLLCPDNEEYTKTQRKTYFSTDELPFPLAEGGEELCRIITELDTEAYAEALRAFNLRIGSFECGTASRSVAENIEKFRASRVD